LTGVWGSMTKTSTLWILATSIACSAAEVVFGVPAEGAEARIALTSVQGVGGQVFRSTLTIDSASAHYAFTSCSGSVSSDCTEEQAHSGTVSRVALDAAFREAQAKEFRDLLGEYKLPGDIVPPDGGAMTLTVTVGERQKVIIWHKHATAPDALARFICRVNALGGSLAQCAE
jgi:hypothetical protein